jgi:hypothetical protein
MAGAMTSVEWQSGQAITQWGTPSIPWTEWTVGFDLIGMSHLSTEYVIIPVSATKAGLPYNPVADVVKFAFMPTPTQVPQVSDWVAGAWDTDTTNVLYPYSAKCLVGPTGAITLGIGTYIIYLMITDNPEIPVLIGGQLQIQ